MAWLLTKDKKFLEISRDIDINLWQLPELGNYEHFTFAWKVQKSESNFLDRLPKSDTSISLYRVTSSI